MNWTKLEPVKTEDINQGCACCPVPSRIADMDMQIAVGFGMAVCTKDGELVYDGEADYSNDIKPKTVGDMEKLAADDPDHDWRIIMHAPLHGETYQRHCANIWVMVESNEGFA